MYNIAYVKPMKNSNFFIKNINYLLKIIYLIYNAQILRQIYHFQFLTCINLRMIDFF